MNRHFALTLGLSLIGLATVTGCTDDNSPVEPASPFRVATPIAGGDGQTALRGTELPQPLQVKVEAGGVPQPGVRVTWQPSAGSVLVTSSLTDSAGLASARWILGSVPGPMTIAATVDGVGGPPPTFTATALPLVTLVMDSTTNGQVGVVNTALAAPLRVRVFSEGVPSAGASVEWKGSSIGFSPASSTTDAAGYAVTTATLGTVAGVVAATAEVSTALPVSFLATAVAGPPTRILIFNGDGQTVPANLPIFDVVAATISDQYSNRVEGGAITWTVESGPVSVANTMALTDERGYGAAWIEGDGTPGAAVVRAALPGGGAFVDFHFTVEPPIPVIRLDTGAGEFGGTYQFVSVANGSRPAVDTIPAGTTMTWIISPYDYQQHGLAFFGASAVEGGEFRGHRKDVTFSTPGSYTYTDPYSFVSGTLVVQ